MKLIDQYILKRFLTTFVFVVLIFLAVITVIDITEKIDKYVEAGLSTMQILRYYGNFIPWIASLITPIIIFIAAVYVCARMAGHTEIIAILSAGVSFNRLLFPFFLGAGIIAGISFYLNGWIIPKSNKTRLAFEVQYIKKNFISTRRNIHIQIAPETILYMKSFDSESNIGRQFTIEKFDKNRLIEKLTAREISWDSTIEKWSLKDWEIKQIDAIFEQSSVKKDQNNHGKTMDTTLVIHPKEFENDYRKYDGMTLNELDNYIETLKARGSAGVEFYLVEKYSRYASPISIFILVFLAVIVSSRKSRGGTGLQIALGFVLSFIFLVFFVLFKTFAEANAPITVWVPNIIFAVIALLMYRKASK